MSLEDLGARACNAQRVQRGLRPGFLVLSLSRGSGDGIERPWFGICLERQTTLYRGSRRNILQLFQKSYSIYSRMAISPGLPKALIEESDLNHTGIGILV